MSWKDRSALVTGAGGFIGSHLVKRLLDEGAQVHILLKENESTWRIKDTLDRLVVWEADITDLTSLQSILPRVKPTSHFSFSRTG